VAIKQNSKIQVRSGLQQNLPQLSQGEFGWAIDSQKLFIGNGNVANGAPFAGNTEILTVLSSSGNSAAYIPVSGTFNETPNGTRTVFTTVANVAPIPATAIIWDNFPLVQNVGYTISGFQVTFTNAPGSGDTLYWQGFIN
jgi:hypothetical protein